MILAAAAGMTGVMSILLEAGADPDAIDHHGRSALLWASGGGWVEAVDLLLGRGKTRHDVAFDSGASSQLVLRRHDNGGLRFVLLDALVSGVVKRRLAVVLHAEGTVLVEEAVQAGATGSAVEP